MTPVGIQPLPSRANPSLRRGPWRLEFSDGSLMKARRLETPERAAAVEYLAGLCTHLPMASVLARRGCLLLESWIPGPTFDTILLGLDRAEAMGTLLGRLSRAGQGDRLADPGRQRLLSALEKLEKALTELTQLQVLHADVASRLLERALANAPEHAEAGLVHLDVQPRNVVHRPDGPWLVDNELLEVGPLDLDLARTWLLWPMGAAEQARFLKGYETYRSVASFRLHELFWAIYVTACSLAYRLRSGLPQEGLLSALNRLASGDLPRVWTSPGGMGMRSRQ